MEKNINIDGYKIVVTLDGDSGSISSNLRDTGDDCELDNEDVESPENLDSRRMFENAMDAVESVILAHACAGVDIESKEYVEGLKTAIDAISNNV